MSRKCSQKLPPQVDIIALTVAPFATLIVALTGSAGVVAQDASCSYNGSGD
jgi:hypothetical protein